MPRPLARVAAADLRRRRQSVRDAGQPGVRVALRPAGEAVGRRHRRLPVHAADVLHRGLDPRRRRRLEPRRSRQHAVPDPRHRAGGAGERPRPALHHRAHRRDVDREPVAAAVDRDRAPVAAAGPAGRRGGALERRRGGAHDLDRARTGELAHRGRRRAERAQLRGRARRDRDRDAADRRGLRAQASRLRRIANATSIW